MQYRDFAGEDVSLLGFGAMRFPYSNGKIDETTTIAMMRYAIDNGVNYIDTAPVYHDGLSEGIVAKTLKDGYREKVFIATKNPSWNVHTLNDWDSFLDKSLQALQTDCIDFYLQHALDAERFDRLSKIGFFEHAEEVKKQGKIKYFGFSFHDEYPAFEEIINAYDWDFCQIQLNYLDTDYQAGLRGLKLAAERGISTAIMEPIRGGKLADVPSCVADSFTSTGIERSPAAWALRYLADMEEVSIILSGMSSEDQVKENVSVCSESDMLPGCMTDAERTAIDNAVSEFRNTVSVNCTACRYCMPCPAGVDIPKCFSIYDHYHFGLWDNVENARRDYKSLGESNANGSICIECGQCVSACPQAINIPVRLKEADEILRA